MTKRELEARMSSAELVQWQAEYLLRAQEREQQEAMRKAQQG